MSKKLLQDCFDSSSFGYHICGACFRVPWYHTSDLFQVIIICVRSVFFLYSCHSFQPMRAVFLFGLVLQQFVFRFCLMTELLNVTFLYCVLAILTIFLRWKTLQVCSQALYHFNIELRRNSLDRLWLCLCLYYSAHMVHLSYLQR